MVKDLKGKEVTVGCTVREKIDGKTRLIEVTELEEAGEFPLLARISGIDKKEKWQTSTLAMFCTVVQ